VGTDFFSFVFFLVLFFVAVFSPVQEGGKSKKDRFVVKSFFL